MSERYKPRRLKREWQARIAAGETPGERQQREAQAQAAFDRRQVVRNLEGGRRPDLLCTHNAPWLDCRICSKPRHP